jgi:predicted AlkP superfamily pyrophosphatase or phosphodiesterase
MKRPVFAITVLALLFALESRGVVADEAVVKRVLVIGIDGVRTDALKAAQVPNLRQLVREGAISENTTILGDRHTGADTVSGPGWSNILTGVWPDKHGVKDNKFKEANYKQYPHFFQRLKQVRPQAVTISLTNWAPMSELIVSGADVSFLSEGAKREKPDYGEEDARVATEAVRLLKEKNPDAMFVYFGNVDETGHKTGFHPAVAEYMQALEQVDRHVGTLLETVRARPSFAKEDWLTLVCTDHGGRGTNHGGGHLFEEVRTVFLIVSGPSAARGSIDRPTQQVDVPTTALTHLGVKIDPAWNLDGRAVGLR